MRFSRAAMAICLATAAYLIAAASTSPALAQATLMPPGENCFQATTGINGMVGLLGTITAGSGGTTGTYGGVALTGGSGSGATANITVSGGGVTGVTILNPGTQYVVGDVLSAAAVNIGNTAGFSVPVSSTSINSSLAGGSVGMYVPNTQTFKQTWQNSTQSTLNSNPVPLDSNGCATIYGAGVYTQILYDSLGNTVWNRLTMSTNSTSPFWAGFALGSGTANAIQVTDASFSGADGQSIQFIAIANNTGATTVNPSGFGNVPVVKDTSTGPQALTGGEIVNGNVVTVTYDLTNSEFHLASSSAANPCAPSGSSPYTITCGTFQATAGYLFGSQAAFRFYSIGGNTNLYVGGTGANDANNCLAPTLGSGNTGPCATISHAVNIGQNNIDGGGNIVAVNVAAGTYTDSVQVKQPVIGNVEIQIIGAGSGSVTLLASTAQYAIFAKDSGAINITGMTLGCSTGAAGEIYTGQSGIVDIGADIVFGACANASIITADVGGHVNLTANTTIAGGAQTFVFVNGPSHFDFGHAGYVITVSGTPNFTIAFIDLLGPGLVEGSNETFSGSATGTKWNVTGCGYLTTAGRGPNTVFPGNANGTLGSCGQDD